MVLSLSFKGQGNLDKIILKEILEEAMCEILVISKYGEGIKVFKYIIEVISPK
jgi:hypothetical protein